MRILPPIRRLLASHAPSRTCPEEVMLAAYADGQLFGAEKRRVQNHLSRCEQCRDTVGIVLRAARAEPRPAPGDALAAASIIGERARSGTRWAVPLAGMAALALV